MGSWASCDSVTLWAISVDSVLSIEASAVTVTDSEVCPTSNAMSSRSVWPATNRKDWRV